jgi:1-acyl-sn-glycerol-3-phosphate acyltransferase
MSWLARLLLHVFFRRVEVEGAENVPESGPVVFVANHNNSLVDPALLLGFLPRNPRFLAKSTLWEVPIVRPFLELAEAIPVYRRRDGSDPTKNTETFAACHRALADGGAVAIFPEGTSHSEPGLVPLKTGVSRIVLGAERELGPLGVRIVPVGLVFDDKGRFRSRALVRVGEPLDPSPELARCDDEPREAVRDLTGRVREALAEVTLNYPSWEEGRLIERAADILAQPEAELPAERPLADRFAVGRAFIDGYAELREDHPEAVAELAETVRDYDEMLRRFRLRDEQVAARYHPAGVVRFTAKSLFLLLVRLPLAAVGTLVHYLPYRAAGWVAERPERDPDVVATYKLMAGMVFCPLTWLALAALAGWRWGLEGGLAALVAAPATGVVALRFHERRSHFRRQLRAFLLLRRRRGPARELRRLRGEVLRRVGELAELLGAPG